MEQITISRKSESTFLLSAFCDYNLYEAELHEHSFESVQEETFESEFVELQHLADFIQEGLGKVKSIDPNLQVTTTFHIDSIEDTLVVDLHITYQKGKLKARKEDIHLVLKKKHISPQATLENVIHGLKKKFHIPHIKANTLNIFVDICETEKTVIYNNPIQKHQKIKLVDGKNIQPDFLDFILSKDNELCQFFLNRLNSQDQITQKMSETLNNYFQTNLILQFVLNWMSLQYYINFIKACKNGTQFMLNVSIEKVPKQTNYYVCENIQDFEFDEKMNYLVHTEFENVVEEGGKNIDIIRKQNAAFDDIRVDGIVMDQLYTTDKNGNPVYIRKSSGGFYRFYKDHNFNTLYTIEDGFIEFKYISIRCNGKQGIEATNPPCIQYMFVPFLMSKTTREVKYFYVIEMLD